MKQMEYLTFDLPFEYIFAIFMKLSPMANSNLFFYL